jgi:hypothetical protein
MNRRNNGHARRYFAGLIAVFLLSLWATGTTANPVAFMIELETAATGRVSVYTLPDGWGHPFTYAYQWDGVIGHSPEMVDATLTLTLTGDGEPIVGWPAEEIWLEATSGNLLTCVQGACADHPTDAQGQTTFTLPLLAGGHTALDLNARIYGVVSGEPGLQSLVDVQVNSPDLSGDLVVNLTDVAMFASQYMVPGGYTYAADLYWDGRLNLSDLALMAAGFATGCP